MFQSGEPSVSNPATVSALKQTISEQRLRLNHMSLQLRDAGAKWFDRNQLLDKCFHKMKQLNEDIQNKALQEQQMRGLLQDTENSLQDRTRQIEELQRTIDSQKANVRTLQTKLDYAKAHINSLTEDVAKLDRRLLGKSEPVLTPGAHKWQLIKDVEQAIEVHGAGSVPANIKQNRLDLFLQTEGQQSSRNALPAASSGQVPNSPNEDLAAAHEKIKKVEDALRVKTLQWQELHQKFEQQQHRHLEVANDIKGLWAMIHSLRDKLLFEKESSAGFRYEVERLERQIAGRAVLPITEEVRMERLLAELGRIAEVHGEEHELYRTKQKQLDLMLTAQHDHDKAKAAKEAQHATEEAEEAEQAQLVRRSKRQQRPPK